MQGALSGIRVVETATMLAAPVAGMLLGDFGAEVIKIELPGDGDQLRAYGYQKDGISLFWKMLARNKRSITLDLRKPKGRDIFLRLIEKADVYIENFRPGTPEKWGIGADDLRKIKPDLIAARVSGFGQTGPNKNRPGFGTLAEAMSGFANGNGWPDRPPSLPSLALADPIAGVMTAFGILVAVRQRERAGQGQDIDVALYEPLLTILGTLLMEYQQLGIVHERMGNVVPFSAPRNAYLTKDGRYIAMASATQQTTQRIFDAIGHPELMQDPRFCNNQQRLKNTAALDDHISAWTEAHDHAEAMSILEGHNVTVAPIYNAVDILNDEHIKARGSIATIIDEDLGELVMQAPVPKMSATPGKIEFAGRKQPGFDNVAIYRDLLGFDEDELERLAAERII